MSDAPTQGFDSQPPVNNDAAKSRLPLILGIIGGVLLILVIVLLVLLLGKNTATPTAAETTSPPTDSSDSNSTPVPVRTVTVTETPPPSSGTVAPEKPNGNNVLITQYTITPSTIKCSAGQTQLHITWKSVNGNVAFFGVNTVDAQAGGMGWNLPASGTDHDFGAFSAYPYMVSCNTTPNSYTLTVDGNGSKQSLTIKLKQTP